MALKKKTPWMPNDPITAAEIRARDQIAEAHRRLMPVHRAPARNLQPPLSLDASQNLLPLRGPCNILIVEDNLDILKLLGVLMTEAGHRVETADRAESAIELLPSFTPDVVLVDIRLPGMNGLELTRLVKLAGGSRKVPVVAVTANDSPAAIREAYDAGCDGYITKPVDINRFALIVRQYLDHGSTETS
jgi:CheY-like chemotaxis protein